MTLTGKTAHDLYASKEKDGVSPQSLCCPDPDVHKARLQAAAIVINDLYQKVKTEAPFRVLDVGAGFGDLAPYLDKSILYTGVEAQTWMVDKNPHKVELVAMDGAEYIKNTLDGFFEVVVALGLVATFTPEELTAFGKETKRIASTGRVVSWQRDEVYTGRFQSWTLREMVDAFGPIRSVTTAVAHDTEFTGMF